MKDNSILEIEITIEIIDVKIDGISILVYNYILKKISNKQKFKFYFKDTI